MALARLPRPTPSRPGDVRRRPAFRGTTGHRVGRGGALALVGVLTLVAAACSDSPDTSGGAFCGALQEKMAVIQAPVSDAVGIDALVDVYEELDARTPLAISEPWSELTELVRTAATVAPDDPASVQQMADTAYATERSARAVATWVAQTCGFAMPAMSGVEGTVAPPPADASGTKPGTKPGKKPGKNSGMDSGDQSGG